MSDLSRRLDHPLNCQAIRSSKLPQITWIYRTAPLYHTEAGIDRDLPRKCTLDHSHYSGRQTVLREDHPDHHGCNHQFECGRSRLQAYQH